jgi:hypothetical protein
MIYARRPLVKPLRQSHRRPIPRLPFLGAMISANQKAIQPIAYYNHTLNITDNALLNLVC